MTDLAVATFVAILVVAALYLPRWGDAVGRLVRGRDRPAGPAGSPSGDEPRRDR